MLSSRLRSALPAASLLAAGVLVAGCSGSRTTGDTPSAGSPTGSGTPATDRVCAEILPTTAVTGLLPPGPALASTAQEPVAHYPVLRCQVTAGGATFIGSAYLFNMAGTDLVRLPGLTSTASAPIGGEPSTGLYGMAGGDDAWLVRECKVVGVDDPVGLLVRARTYGPADSAATDRRQQLADVAVDLANGVASKAECGDPTPRPGTIRPATVPTPVTDAPICDMLDPAALGPAAAGDARRRWTAAATPKGPGAVQGCDLFLDAKRVLSLAIVHGWLAPSAEAPGERDTLSERLRTPGVPDDRDRAGTVLGKVQGTCDNHTVAYQLSRHNGDDPPGQTLGQPTETLFKAFANGAADWGFACKPIPADARWQIRN
jgi:hypothetical protein